MNALKLLFEQIHPLWIIAKFTLWGGSSTPDTTTQISELPEWARGYAKDTLSKASAITDISKNPYQTYGGERIAGFQPLQQQAMGNAANMGPSEQVGAGSALAGAAGLGALGTNYQGSNVQGGQFDSQAAQQYMNPYTQNVVDYQKSQALRDFQIAQPMRQAQAVQQGAFGGSRSAIVDAEAQRSLNSQMQGIEATGQQNAYQNAQQQYNADQARRMQAQQTNEQSRQYGAGLGMQGLQTALQSANTLGTLGQNQYTQEMGINQLQNQYGAQQQAQAQKPLDTAYQDFVNQQNYPYKQLGFMSDMIRGLPLGQQSSGQVYQGSGNIMGQVAGLGMGAYGLSQMGVKLAGGGLADGGDVNDPNNIEAILGKLSDAQLQQAKKAALDRRDVNEAQMVDAEIARRASVRQGTQAMPQGIAPALPEQFADGMEQSMATGGIVAFADKGQVKETPGKARSTVGGALSDMTNYLQERYREGMEKLQNEEAANAIKPGLFESVTPQERKEREARADLREKGTGGAKKVPPLSQDKLAAISSDPSVNPAPSTQNLAVTQTPAFLPEAGQFGASTPQKTASTRATGSAPAAKASVKIPDQLQPAVSQLAEQTGQKEDDVKENMKSYMQMFQDMYAPSLEAQRKMVEASKPDNEAIKQQGLAQALTAFGFKMAANASKSGSRFLESASAAAPEITSAAQDMNKLMAAKQENYQKMNLDQMRYENALTVGNMKDATMLANQLRQSKQLDKQLALQYEQLKQQTASNQAQLAETIRAHQASESLANRQLGVTAGYYNTLKSKVPDTIPGLAELYINDPSFKGTKMDAYNLAAKQLHGGIGADIRADASVDIQLQKDIEKIDETFRPLMAFTTDPAKLAALQTTRDAEVLAKMKLAGRVPGGNTNTATGTPAPSGQWGDLKVKQ